MEKTPLAAVTLRTDYDDHSGYFSSMIFSTFTAGKVDVASSTHTLIYSGGYWTTTFDVTGVGLTYDADQRLQGGRITAVTYTEHNNYAESDSVIRIEGLDASVTDMLQATSQRDPAGGMAVLLGGDDTITGTTVADNIWGGAGGDTIFGGPGNDYISGNREGPQSNSQADGSNYLRGDDGADVIYGGGGFDDINGNKGNDTCYGGQGGDWVVGGQGDDKLYGGDDDDVVYGNLGADTCNGDSGADWVRGGQGDDICYGGDGDDLIWGDRGDDTLTGGQGADTFHTFVGADGDRVTDFNYAEGDRVVVDGGANYTLAQVGSDVVITLAEHTTMTLVHVTLASLPSDWISVGG